MMPPWATFIWVAGTAVVIATLAVYAALQVP